MNRCWKPSALLLLPLLLAACGKQETPQDTPSGPTKGSPAPSAATRLKIGYVLHGQNDFTQVIKQGAEDAGKALGVDVEIQAPSAFANSNEAIGIFEAMTQKKKDGLITVPMPGAVWVRPIQQATEAGIPVMTANMTSPDSTSPSWFGQDEYQSGVVLATELRKFLDAEGKKDGKIVVGICAPAVEVLQWRYKGFKKGMEGTNFQISDAKDVTAEPTSNLSAWENLAVANPDTVAIVGLCSMDIPNLAKLKARANAKWLVAGYDLNIETLDAIKAGTVQLTLGQHPYLQGYLPVLALTQHLRDKKPLPQGWVNVGTEVVTKANVDSVYPREKDAAAATKWYADYIAKNFADLAALAKPLPGPK